MMSVFRLPGGQIRESRGYVANFAQDITPLSTELPRLTSSLSLLILTKNTKKINLKIL